MQPSLVSSRAPRLATLFACACLALVSLVFGPAARAAASDPLAAYVHAVDPSFSWKVSEKKSVPGGELTTIALVSQTWREGPWRHQLHVLRPSAPRHPSFASLLVTSSARPAVLEAARSLAARSGGLVAVLTAVPNQPLFGGLKEDQIIAYTFDEFLKTGDTTWPLLLPMTKSAVRAMDALQAWARSEKLPPPEKFVVFGASKRGWTSWLAAAVDPRIVGVAPMVIDMLNMKAQTDWAAKVYGQQSEQIRDYTKRGLIEKMDLPPMRRLRDIVDPYSHRARYVMPKLLLLGTNDRYWTVDSLRHYWNDLPEPKLLYQAPNAGHEAGNTPAALDTLAAFCQMLADGKPLPRVTWSLSAAGGAASLSVASDRPAKKAVLWSAESPTRDFRPAKWSSRPLELDATRTRASARVPSPAQGFAAALIELAFETDSGLAYRLSTQVQVTPDE